MPVHDLCLSALLMLDLRGAKTSYLLADTVAAFLTFPNIHTSLMLLWCVVNQKFIHIQREDIRYIYTTIGEAIVGEVRKIDWEDGNLPPGLVDFVLPEQVWDEGPRHRILHGCEITPYAVRNSFDILIISIK